MADSSRENAEADVRITPAALHALLKARDAEFDNLTVSCGHSRVERIDVTRRIAGLSRLLPPQEEGHGTDIALPASPPPFDGEIVHRVDLTIRGSELTLTRSTLSDPRTKYFGGRYQLSNQMIHSTVTGIVRTATSSGDSRWHLTKTTAPILPDNAILRERRKLTLVCGLGYGRLIKRIDHVEVGADGLTRIEGTATLHDDDDTLFTIRLDRQHIVRSAVLDVDLGTHRNRIEVTTSGELTPPSVPPLPARATWVRVILDATAGSERVERTVERDKYKFLSAKTHLSDADYAAASAFFEEHVFESVAEMNPATKATRQARTPE
jgi:hypothetical protein